MVEIAIGMLVCSVLALGMVLLVVVSEVKRERAALPKKEVKP